MIKQKKVPLRTCVVTREKLPKQMLIRIVRTPDGEVEIDLTGKKNGRGAYIKKDISALKKAKKSKQLERHLEVQIKDDVYEALERLIIDESTDT